MGVKQQSTSSWLPQEMGRMIGGMDLRSWASHSKTPLWKRQTSIQRHLNNNQLQHPHRRYMNMIGVAVGGRFVGSFPLIKEIWLGAGHFCVQYRPWFSVVLESMKLFWRVCNNKKQVGIVATIMRMYFTERFGCRSNWGLHSDENHLVELGGKITDFCMVMAGCDAPILNNIPIIMSGQCANLLTIYWRWRRCEGLL
jgi:hypothetical protein